MAPVAGKLIPILLGDPAPTEGEKDRWHEFMWIDEHGKPVLKRGRINGGMLFTGQDATGIIMGGNLVVSLIVPNDEPNGSDGQYGYGPGGIIKKVKPPA